MKPRKAPMKRTPLRSLTALQRTAEIKRSGPVKPRKSRQHPETSARKLMPKRSDGVCEIGVPRICIGLASVCSHRLRRSQSNLAVKWSPVNWLNGCLPCERYLTDEGGNSKCQSFGWTVSAAMARSVARASAAIMPPDTDPIVFALSLIPVFRRGEFVWLRDDGAVIRFHRAASTSGAPSRRAAPVRTAHIHRRPSRPSRQAGDIPGDASGRRRMEVRAGPRLSDWWYSMTFDVENGIHVLNRGRRLLDPLTQHTVKMADDAAERMRVEFGDKLDMETCGKALVIAAGAVVPLCHEEIPGAVLANLIGFMGESLVRGARRG